MVGSGDELAQQPERRVDIALYRTEPTIQWVGKDVCLRRGARYWLRILIGSPLPGSLMATPSPPIDPLLPPPTSAGYELQVLVNAESFTIQGSSAARLILPLHQPSAPVDFLVQAPLQDGPAQLYVAIYAQGNVLQSFILDAEIATDEVTRTGEIVLQVRLLFSNTARFSNLGALRDRALSIGVGDPRPGVTAPLRLAGSSSSVSIRLAELMTAQQVADYRGILEAATFDAARGPRFFAYPSAQKPQRPGVEDVLRSLARLGANLYRGFYLQADKATRPAGRFPAPWPSPRRVQGRAGPVSQRPQGARARVLGDGRSRDGSGVVRRNRRDRYLP